MKKLLILVFTLALATSAFAQKKATANYSGVVDKYDTATKTLIIKKGDKQGEFVVTDTSEITKDKAKADDSPERIGGIAEDDLG